MVKIRPPTLLLVGGHRLPLRLAHVEMGVLSRVPEGLAGKSVGVALVLLISFFFCLTLFSKKRASVSYTSCDTSPSTCHLEEKNALVLYFS